MTRTTEEPTETVGAIEPTKITNGKTKRRLSFDVIKAAREGDGDAMMSVLRHFDGYMRRLARICDGGTTSCGRGSPYLPGQFVKGGCHTKL